MRALTRAEKSAVVILSLGEEVAAQVFRHLETKEIKQISQNLWSASAVESEQIESILQEFHEELNKGQYVLPNGIGFIEGVLQKALGADEGKRLLEEIELENPQGLDVLDDVDSRTLASIIQKEHPQTIALVMAHTDPFKASQTIAALPEMIQSEVIYRIAQLDAVSKDVMKEVESVLLDEIRGLGALGAHRAGGVKLVADILNQMEKSDEVRIFDKLQDINSIMSEEIRQLMFVFDDVTMADDRGLQELFKEVGHDILVLALRTANEEVKDKIMRNMSQRASQMLLEDIDSSPPVRLSDVERAQQEIVRMVLKLEEAGRLIISRGNEDTFV